MKTLRIIIFLSTIICSTYLFNACSDEPTKPPPPPVDQEPEDTTTTSNFTRIYYDTLGVAYSGLGGVTIINNDSAWVGGIMCIRDSTGKIDDANFYNAAHWNGVRWQLERITFSVTMRDGSLYRTNRVGIGTIVSVQDDDIWFVSHMGGITRLHKGKFEEMKVPFEMSSGLAGAWMSALSPTDILFSGAGGSIIRWNGQNFSRMETPYRSQYFVLENIQYVSPSEAYAVGGDYSTGEGIVIKYDGTSWSTMIESNFLLTHDDSARYLTTLLFGPLEGIWKDDKGKLYVSGNFITSYYKAKWIIVHGIPGNSTLTIPRPMGFVRDIYGLHYNDIIIAGQRSFIMHFNGRRWESIGLGYDRTSTLQWFNVQMKDNFSIAVGEVGPFMYKGILMRMYR